MKIGRMDCRIEAWKPVFEKNAFGEQIPRWESAGKWWAERTSYSGSTHDEASEHFADVRARWNLRIEHKIVPGWQIDGDDGLRYIVAAVEPNRRRGMQTIVCERLNP